MLAVVRLCCAVTAGTQRSRSAHAMQSLQEVPRPCPLPLPHVVHTALSVSFGSSHTTGHSLIPHHCTACFVTRTESPWSYGRFYPNVENSSSAGSP